jgi:hypothetical protein
MRRAGKLMFAGGVLFPVILAASLIIDNGVPMIVPIFVLFMSLVWMLYARFFIDNTARVKQAAQISVLSSMPARGSLPPAANSSIPVAGRQQVRTNELAQPPSVTENTTRLLDNE